MPLSCWKTADLAGTLKWALWAKMNNAGQCCIAVLITHPTWTASDLPFGGVKNSGYGRELSRLGIQEFVNKRLVRTQPIDAPV